MELWELLQIRPGIVCAVGGGGKTTLLHRLAASLPGRVIFCTTTKIFPSAQMPVLCQADASQIASLLLRQRAVCIGTPTEEGKLAAPRLSFSALRQLADYILVEADGSKNLPMKAHLEGEPVIPPGAERVLLVVGSSGFGKPIREAAHRPERYAELAGATLDDELTPQRAAAVIRKEGFGDTVIVNQAAAPEQILQARELASCLSVPVFAGEVREDQLERV